MLTTLDDIRAARRLRVRFTLTETAGTASYIRHMLGKSLVTAAGTGAGYVPTAPFISDIPTIDADGVVLSNTIIGRTTGGFHDLIWVGPSIDGLTLGTTTLGSVAFPARDDNKSSDGVGFHLFAFGATSSGGAPVFTMSYTNSDGTSGRTATTMATTSNGVNGHVFPLALQAGDVGVRSVESFTVSTAATSTGTFIPLVMRLLTTASTITPSAFAIATNRQGRRGRIVFPALYDGTVLQPWYLYETGPSSRTFFHDLEVALEAP